MNVDKYRVDQLDRANERTWTGSRCVPHDDVQKTKNQNSPPRNPLGKLAEGKNASSKKVGLSENNKGGLKHRNTTTRNGQKAVKIILPLRQSFGIFIPEGLLCE